MCIKGNNSFEYHTKGSFITSCHSMVFYNDKESTELSQRDKGSNVIQLHCHNKLISSIDKKIEWGCTSNHGEIRLKLIVI